jgi:Cu-processing system permease protein
MRLRETALITARELVSATRGRWFAFSSVSFFVLSVGLALLGLAGAERSGIAGFDRTTASLLNLALIFVPLLTFSVGALGIAGELEDGSMALYAGGDAFAFLSLLGLLMVYSASTLAIGTLFSVLQRSRVRAMGAAFAAWLLFVYVSDLGTIGIAIARGLAPAQLLALALLNPVEQARVAGTLALTSRLEVLGPVGIFALDHFGPRTVATLLHVLLAGTAFVLVALGQRIFRKAVLA